MGADINGLFIELLQVSLGTRAELSRVPSAHEWDQLFLKAEDQAIIGLLLCGLERLSAEQLPPMSLKLQWIGEVQIGEATYRQHLKVIAKTFDCLKQGGVPVAFMKGVVCGSRYPLSERRSCGDIDFVVAGKDFARTLDLLEEIGTVDRGLIHEYHGMAFVDEVTLEPHYKVHNFQNPAVDHAMKEMCVEVFPERLELLDLKGEKIPVFPAAFECALLVGHMVNHVYAEGLGLRQVVDFFYWLKVNGYRLSVVGEREEIWGNLRRMKMERAFRVFARICEEYLGLDAALLGLSYSDKEKQFAHKMMEDVLRVGNFAHSVDYLGGNESLQPLKSYFWVVGRCCKLGYLCPAEARWWPVSKVRRFLWKKGKQSFTLVH